MTALIILAFLVLIGPLSYFLVSILGRSAIADGSAAGEARRFSPTADEIGLAPGQGACRSATPLSVDTKARTVLVGILLF